MKCSYACRSAEHHLSRRSFVGGLTSGITAFASGLGGALAMAPAVAEQIKSKHKRILDVFMHGGVSQLETWDPKPNTDTGGPFRAIQTSATGTRICELLPHTAKQMHRM